MPLARINYGPLGIPAVAGLWPQWLSTGTAGACAPTLQLTSQNFPAMLYFGFPATPAPGETLVQEAYDGTQWVQTTLPGTFQDEWGAEATPEGVWGLDASDNLHALVATYDLSSDYRVATPTWRAPPPAP